MRYYKFELCSSAEQIKENAKVNLRDYSYDNPVEAMTMFMRKSISNNRYFFVYREENNKLLAAFAYDEEKSTFQEVYEEICDVLKENFLINKIAAEPSEITMFQYYDKLEEGKRRNYGAYRVVPKRDDWFYPQYLYSETDHPRYEFREYLASEGPAQKHGIYDAAFIDELNNIEEHMSEDRGMGNMVHYIISGRSIEVAFDMTKTLMQSLYRANRISSRRMAVISEIDPCIYKGRSHIEDIIENNLGGTVVFNLTEKLGHSPTEYMGACEYIMKMFKRYKNKCLFIFNYNIDQPGFSYYLLPELGKYAIPLTLREGCGDRKTAVKYLKELINNSDYAKYAYQSEEFMKLFPGDEFSQADVLEAYEKFEPWCVNKNILHAYNFDVSDDFSMDREERAANAYEKFNNLIGLKEVKAQIERIVAADIVEKERKRRMGRNYQSSCMHMIFAGNPGTAKTTVAELFAGIAKQRGILKSGAFVVRGGMDLDGVCCVYDIRDAFRAAKGGVLFIDEAYSLKSQIATTTLIQEMENRRDEVIVILAGYNDRMEAFLEQNEGLKSRIPHWVDFPDYSTDELLDIFKLMLDERGFTATEDACEEARYIFDKKRVLENFGNGRYVRNLIDCAVLNQSERLLASTENVEKIRKDKLFLFKKEDISELEEGTLEAREPGTARKELNELIGLDSAKKIINKAIANYKLNKLCLDRGLDRGKASMHMVFTGNPGTAKTTVARLLAEILKDEKVLSSGTFAELGRADLVGPAVGTTAILVKRRFKEAQGGILFIDEAYSLCDHHENSFGDEAINTIVQEMENHREDTIVIFAGYPGPMKDFLDRNPGMKSRVAFQVEFDDYSTDELCNITKLMLSKKSMTISDEAMEKMRKTFDAMRVNKDFGNGRFVRKMLEEAEMNIAERLLEDGAEDISTEAITRIEECDIPDVSSEEKKTRAKIGFIKNIA